MEPTMRTNVDRPRSGRFRFRFRPRLRVRAPEPANAAARTARRRRDGQSLVEFAVVLPIFLLILAGILDFGLGLYSQMTVINAAREGARLGVVEPGNVSDIDDRVQAMTAGLDQSQLTTTVIVPAAVRLDLRQLLRRRSGSPATPSWSKVVYNYRMLWPLALGNHLDLSSTVQMRIE